MTTIHDYGVLGGALLLFLSNHKLCRAQNSLGLLAVLDL